MFGLLVHLHGHRLNDGAVGQVDRGLHHLSAQRGHPNPSVSHTHCVFRAAEPRLPRRFGHGVVMGARAAVGYAVHGNFIRQLGVLNLTTQVEEGMAMRRLRVGRAVLSVEQVGIAGGGCVVHGDVVRYLEVGHGAAQVPKQVVVPCECKVNRTESIEQVGIDTAAAAIREVFCPNAAIHDVEAVDTVGRYVLRHHGRFCSHGVRRRS